MHTSHTKYTIFTQSFQVSAEVKEHYAQSAARGAAAEAAWDAVFAQYAAQHAELAQSFVRRMAGELPADEEWVDKLPGNPAVSVQKQSCFLCVCCVWRA